MYSSILLKPVAGVCRASASTLDDGAGVNLCVLGVCFLQNLLIIYPASDSQNAGFSGDVEVAVFSLRDSSDGLTVFYDQVFYSGLMTFSLLRRKYRRVISRNRWAGAESTSFER